MWKTNNSINDSKRRKRQLPLSCSKKTLQGITSKPGGTFFCLNCLHSFKAENKDLCEILKPSEKDNILEFNWYMKSDKMTYIIYANIESLI